MFTVFERCLETILTVNTLTLKHRDVLESALSQFFKLGVHIGEKLVLFFLSQCASGFPLDLGYSIHGSLHTIHFE